MKSTGLFGKNSGRVGGVVYSNYRGQQIVRSYQPQVKNPNTKAQVEQRAKFKLVSQLGAVFSKQLKYSFMPDSDKLTPRNSWVKKMLKKTHYSNSKAILPIEEIVLTNSTGGILSAVAEGRAIEVAVSPLEWDKNRVKLQVVVVAYTDGGEIRPISIDTVEPETSPEGSPIPFTYTVSGLQAGIGNVRALVYAYENKPNTTIDYEDYSIDSETATLADIVRVVGLSNMHFSETANLSINMGV